MDWNDIDTKLVLAGNQREITKLYNLIQPWLLFKTYKDEEMAHDVFMKLLNKIDKYNEKRGKFHNFVYTVCVNACNDAFKKENKRKEKNPIDNNKELDYLLLLSHDEEYSEYDLEMDKNLEIMHNAIKNLSTKHKNFLENYLMDKKTKENKERAMIFRIKTLIKKSINE